MPEYRIVLDTNVVLRAVSSKSNLRLILDALYEEAYRLIISTEILLEYEEQLTSFYGKTTAQTFLDFLLLLPNVERIEPFFRLNLITADPDDNKFVDCAFSGNAHYVVSNDRHFNVLASIDFPRITVVQAEEFKALLEDQAS